jgi:F-type H+-transporting ATPase subunit delta
VAKSSSAAHVIANRYATALIDTADSAKALDSVEKDMSELASMLEQSADLKSLISSPLFNRDQQMTSLTAIGQQAGFNKLTVNFLGVLAQNRRLADLGGIIKGFRQELSKRRGEIRAQVKSAFPLTPEQERMLQDSMKKSLGFNVQLETSVDRSLLGGMIVTVGSRMIDDSVKGKLERLKQVMQSQTQSNQNTAMKEVV